MSRAVYKRIGRMPVRAEQMLDGLDPEQRRAAETLRGPVRILAGAGTGKTRTITHRIAYGVLSGAYEQSRVLSLSFTARAAGQLRDRLRRIGVTEVASRTFHAAALAQLSHFWPTVIGGALPELVESKGRLLAQAAERLGLRVDAASLRDVAGEIEWRKTSSLSIDQYGAAGRPLPAKFDLRQVLDLQRGYEELKDERRRLDFEDVLLATVGMLRSEPWTLREVQSRYRFFLVDEYQDVSPLQQSLLDLWLGDRRELCVVGDASQTIYSFAGASAQYLLGFGRRFQDAALVELRRNYRSDPAVLDLANRLMHGRPGAITLRAADRAVSSTVPRLLSAGADAAGSEPRQEAAVDGADAAGGEKRTPTASTPLASVLPVPHVFADERAEAQGVAAAIAGELAAGRSAREIAVLIRTNAQAPLVEAALGERGISYQLRGGRRFFERPEIRDAIVHLHGLAFTEPDTPAVTALRRLLLAELNWHPEPPTEAGAVRERWDAQTALLALAEELAGQHEALGVRSFQEELVRRRDAQHEPELAAVSIVTLHSAKGMEWDSVYLPGLSEGLLPISHAHDEAAIEEERRLLYVGLTRARLRLRLSWSRAAQHRSVRQPSRFLAELVPRVVASRSL